MESTAYQDSTTVRLLDAWKQKKGIDTDYKAAKELGVTSGTPANWRHQRSHAKPALAVRMARDLGMEELPVLAAIEADRAHNGDDRRVWQKHGRSAFMALLLGLSVGLPPGAARAELSRMGQLPVPNQTLIPDVHPHYAKWRRRRRNGTRPPYCRRAA